MTVDMTIVMADYHRGMSVEQLKKKYNLSETDLKKLNEYIRRELGVNNNDEQPLPGSTELTLDDGTKVLAAKVKTVKQPNGGFINTYIAQDGQKYYQYIDENGQQEKVTECWDQLGDTLEAAWNMFQDGHPWEALVTLFAGAEDPRLLNTGIAPCINTKGFSLKSLKNFKSLLNQLKKIKNFKEFKTFARSLVKQTKPQVTATKPTQNGAINVENIDQVITTSVPGQKVVITSNLENPSEFIATFFENGIPSTTSKLPLEKLQYFISTLK